MPQVKSARLYSHQFICRPANETTPGLRMFETKKVRLKDAPRGEIELRTPSTHRRTRLYPAGHGLLRPQHFE